ncbi:MAG: chromate transporter [Clostridia bacterium]|jgi:chromate transporter|nr:chromate transporter [Clostridia bacterium]MBQ5602524.1 chromate transporter [Clostridia bacterium]
MIYLELFLTFFKIGIVSFGGGYAMLALMRDEIMARGWLNDEMIKNFIGISESTPGPISVNMATFVGSSQAGFLGSLCATLGLILPSFIIILIIATLLKSLMKNVYVNGALDGAQPVAVGLIAATGISFMISTIFPSFGNVNILEAVKNVETDIETYIIAALIFIFMLVFKKIKKKQPSPVLLILTAALLGIIVCPLAELIK